MFSRGNSPCCTLLTAYHAAGEVIALRCLRTLPCEMNSTCKAWRKLMIFIVALIILQAPGSVPRRDVVVLARVQAKAYAAAAADLEVMAARVALRALENEIDRRAANKAWRKLMNVAAAGDVATKVVRAAEQAKAGWETDTIAARAGAVQAANNCADLAKQTVKHTRSVYSSEADAEVL